MLFVVPDFYDDFHCLAGQCRHSCCIGWEIDIDEESFAYYSGIEGEIGQELREKTSAEPTPHFVLDEGERCPFLNESGLCRLILSLGEDSLCDICREHPRFYNEFSDRTEAGLGLCCEEAVRLLLEGDGPLGLLCYDDGGGESPSPEERALFALREKIFSLLNDGSRPLYSCMAACAECCAVPMPDLDMAKWARFYMGLERLDPAWTDALRLLEDRGGEVVLPDQLDGIKYRRMAAYFVYRHFASAGSPAQASDMLAFALLSTAMVCALETLGLDCGEALRLYSAEIEYSDENIGLILNKIRE